jgi:hypothetical protein
MVGLQTHSNMRMVELCRNFSRGAFKVRTVQKEKYAQAYRNYRAEGEWIKRVWKRTG